MKGRKVMKKFAFISLIILMLSLAAFGQKSKTSAAAKASAAQAAADEKAVRATFEDLLTGIRESNVDAVTGA